MVNTAAHATSNEEEAWSLVPQDRIQTSITTDQDQVAAIVLGTMVLEGARRKRVELLYVQGECRTTEQDGATRLADKSLYVGVNERPMQVMEPPCVR